MSLLIGVDRSALRGARALVLPPRLEERRTARWTGTASLVVPLDFSVTTPPFTILMGALSSNAGTARTFASLHSSDTTLNPSARLRISSANSWQAAWFLTAGSSIAVGGANLVQEQDVVSTAIADFTLDTTNVVPRIWRHSATPGEDEETVASTVAFGAALTHLSVGGHNNATGNDPILADDEAFWVAVYADALTGHQKQQFRALDAPPLRTLFPDPSKIAKLIVISRETMAAFSVAVGDIANVSVEAYTRPAAIRPHTPAGWYPTSQLGVTTSDSTFAYTTSGVTRNIRIRKPATGSGWPAIVFSVGAGGVYTENGDLLDGFAQAGYASVCLEHADAGKAAPWTGGDGTYPAEQIDVAEAIGEAREFTETGLATKLGYTPTQVIGVGHSRGSLPALALGGTTWYEQDDVTPVNLGPAEPQGGGTLLGTAQMSGQSEDWGPLNGAALHVDSLTTHEVPSCWFTGTEDTGGFGGENYAARVENYDNMPAGLAKLKVIFRGGHHQYGGAITRVAVESDKPLDYLQRALAINMLVCWMDYLRGVSAARTQLLSAQPWNGDALLDTFEVANL